MIYCGKRIPLKKIGKNYFGGWTIVAKVLSLNIEKGKLWTHQFKY